MSRNILLISVDVIKQRSNLDDNVDEGLMVADIKVAQDQYIEPLLGTKLFNKLQDEIDSDAGPSEPYKTLWLDYLLDCLMWYTLSMSPETLSFRLSNKGATRKQGDNTSLPTMGEIFNLSDIYIKRAQFYANKAVRYLEQNAVEKFPEYLNSGTGVDTVRPKKFQDYCNIYLGLDGGRDDCHRHGHYDY